MLNYAFVNGNALTSYISDDTFAFRGTWSPSGTYTAPLDVVDYNNGKFIVITTNVGQPPLGTSFWSELALVGTIVPTDPFAIAETAYTTANAASVLALAAAGTATQALNLIASGTTAGTNVAIPSGTNVVFVTGNLGYVPSAIVLTVEVPAASALNLSAELVGRPTINGFTARLSGATDATGYFLHWLARR